MFSPWQFYLNDNYTFQDEYILGLNDSYDEIYENDVENEMPNNTFDFTKTTTTTLKNGNQPFVNPIIIEQQNLLTKKNDEQVKSIFCVSRGKIDKPNHQKKKEENIPLTQDAIRFEREFNLLVNGDREKKTVTYVLEQTYENFRNFSEYSMWKPLGRSEKRYKNALLNLMSVHANEIITQIDKHPEIFLISAIKKNNDRKAGKNAK